MKDKYISMAFTIFVICYYIYRMERARSNNNITDLLYWGIIFVITMLVLK